MLAGRAALRQFSTGASGDRDDIEARDCLLEAFQRRHGLEVLRIPSLYREFHITIAALQRDAEALVAENQAEIAKIANKLARKAQKTAPQPAANAKSTLATS